MDAPSEHRRLWWSLRAVGVVSVVGLVAGGVVRAQAAPAGRSTDALREAKKPAPPTALTTLPTLGPGIPAGRAGGVLIGAADTENLAAKAETVVRFARTYLVIDTLASREANGDQNNDTYVISNPTTVTHEPPDHISFGSFAPVRVSTLALGAIPLQATLHTTQVVLPSGLYEPLDARYRGTSDGQGGYYTLGGQLNVSISDVTLDGVPLHLSPSCRTVTPAHLVAYATGILGDPNYYNPFSGGPFAGNVVIPAFTGCSAQPGGAARAESIDALLDGTISGAANATFLAQTGAGTFDENAVGDCAPALTAGSCTSAKPLPPITGPTPVPTVVTPSLYPPPPY